MIAAVLLIFATATAPDLTYVRTVHFDAGDERARAALEHAMPEFDHVSRDEADVLIDYQEFGARHTVEDTKQPIRWKATLYRIACQSPMFGVPPTPAVGGYCENRIYVRVAIGTLEGSAEKPEYAVEGFVEQFRDAAYGPR